MFIYCFTSDEVYETEFWFLRYLAFFRGYGYVPVAYYSVFSIMCVDGNDVGGIINDCAIWYDRGFSVPLGSGFFSSNGFTC